MATLASIQETTLDVAWIRDGVICFGNRPAEHCYRAVLTTEGPPEAFAVEADRVQPAVDAFASFLNGLAYPIQVLVRALPIDLASYASASRTGRRIYHPRWRQARAPTRCGRDKRDPVSGCSTGAPLWCCRRRHRLTRT